MLQNWAPALMLSMTAGLLSAHAYAAELRLMMIERAGCHWCDRWNAEIGPVYPRTAEGAAAPLLRHDILESIPADITVVSPPQFTPTFILLKDGVEAGRIEGYPGDDFFWGLLGKLLQESGTDGTGFAAP